MIRIGPGGLAGLSYPAGLERIKELGLSALECEFTYGVKMPDAQAKEIGLLAAKMGIRLSVHAPYYINLNSQEKAKIAASKSRILDSCKKASLLGARNIVFHAAFYQKEDPKIVYGRVKDAIIELQKEIGKNKWDVVLSPETTGKKSQFGTLDEILQLKKETGCGICVDFSHLCARNNGKIDYNEIMEKIKKFDIHSHFSGIEFGPKGEKRHIGLSKNFFEPLAKALHKFNPDITIINECPDPINEANKMLEWLK